MRQKKKILSSRSPIYIMALDIIFWLALLAYISGFFVLDLFRIVSAISFIAVVSGVDLSQTTFARAWLDFGDFLNKKKSELTPSVILCAVVASYLGLMFF